LISPVRSGGNVPPYTGEPVVALAADPAVIAKIPAAIYEGSTRELGDLAAKLAKTPGDTESWMRVAHIRHFYHDYAGARDAYEYLTIIADELTVPFHNLGGLYGYYLKEPAKAGPKFEAALTRDPVNVSFYTGFSDFEREVRKDYPASEALLKRGLERVPGDVNLFIALAALYRDTGRTAEAVDYYRRALASSALGEGERAAISAEIKRLEAKTP
jgi:tetratricopeptide (TPR) repeat protein